MRQHRGIARQPGMEQGIQADDPGPRFDKLKDALSAVPYDDEPLTDEDRAAIEAGWEDYRQGRTITFEELRRSFSAENDG